MADGSVTVSVNLRVNAVSYQWQVDAGDTLADLLRERLSLTGCRQTCGIGVCGSCAVMVDGRAVNACLTPGFLLDGAEIVTVEGLDAEGLHPAQRAFIDEQAFQCSFCTPGFLMSTVAMAQETRPWRGSAAMSQQPDPDAALAGQVCRCGSYREIAAAARRVVERPNQP